MQTQSSDEKAVRPSLSPSLCQSVRLSVKRVNCDKTEEDLFRFLYHTKGHLAYFFEKKNGWWGATPFT